MYFFLFSKVGMLRLAEVLVHGLGYFSCLFVLFILYASCEYRASLSPPFSFSHTQTNTHMQAHNTGRDKHTHTAIGWIKKAGVFE